MPHLTIAKNTLFQIISRIVTSGAAFLATILIARFFGISGYGDFTKITAFVGLFYLLIDFGLNAFFLQEETTNNNFKSLFYFRLLLAFVLILIANTIPIFLPFNEKTDFGFSSFVKTGILIFSFTILTNVFTITSSAVFQRKLRYDYLMRAGIIGSLVTLFLVFIFVYNSLSLHFILLAFILGNLLTALLSIFWTKENIFPVFIDYAFIKKLLTTTFPLGITLIFNLVYFRSDIFLLSILKPTADVGVYGFAYKFFDFFIALPLFLSNSLYPFILRDQKNQRNTLSLLAKYLMVFVIFSLIILIPSWFLSPLFILVKKEFYLSIFPFRILILSLPFYFATSVLQWTLIAQREQKYLMFVYFFSTILNIFLNIVFIPVASYVASAIITGVSEAVVFCFLLFKIFLMPKNLQSERKN